ncbi:hypothetical protein CN934_17340 [Ensifer sp. MMN_5]|nr:hypothetical protein CN934_17340 [Ensifer sp. MMN_5]RVQ05511.1 hypothetical protein CN070_02785 [Sinorhizobium meliloti]
MESGTQLKTQLLIPVPVTGIQSDQVLGLNELFPRRRRGAAGGPNLNRRGNIARTSEKERRRLTPPFPKIAIWLEYAILVTRLNCSPYWR